MRILVFGLPGSGKTTFADELGKCLNAVRLNADRIRALYDDWDFTAEGRLRQAERMYTLSVWEFRKTEFVVADFVAPTAALRQHFRPDYAIWMDTIEEGRYPDTNKVWQVPEPHEYQFRVPHFNSSDEAKIACYHLIRNLPLR